MIFGQDFGLPCYGGQQGSLCHATSYALRKSFRFGTEVECLPSPRFFVSIHSGRFRVLQSL